MNMKVLDATRRGTFRDLELDIIPTRNFHFRYAIKVLQPPAARDRFDHLKLKLTSQRRTFSMLAELTYLSDF